MLNLVEVRAFLAVVEAGGFQEAAARLGLAQPTVSLQVRRLEEALGARLLVRGRARSVPTAAGARFLPHARALLHAADRAAAAVCGQGALAVGASGNAGTWLLPPFLARAGAPVDLVIGTNPETAERLAAGEVDMGVMEWWDGRPGFVATPWRREPLVAIVPPGHPWAGLPVLPAAALFDAPMIGGEPGTGTGRLLQAAFGADAARLRTVMTLGSTAAVKEAVKAGLGVSLVMAAAAADDVRAGTLAALPLAGAALEKELVVVLPQDTPPSAPAARFASLLRAAA